MEPRRTDSMLTPRIDDCIADYDGNDGLLRNDMTKNPWHMILLLAYSESYLPVMPSWFQEPLINALAKIAQWKSEDRELYKYFK